MKANKVISGFYAFFKLKSATLLLWARRMANSLKGANRHKKIVWSIRRTLI